MKKFWKIPVLSVAFALAALAALAAGCLNEEITPPSDVPTEGEGRIICGASVVDGADTKASLVTGTATIPNEFLVWGYIKLKDDGTVGYERPNYMVGETFVKMSESSTSWQSTHYFGHVAQDYAVKYWALSGGGSAASDLPTSSSAATPSFTYSLPSEVASQADLMTGWSSEVHGAVPSDATPTLQFEHALSSICFKTKDAGTFTELSLKGMFASGTFTEGSGWSSQTGSVDVSKAGFSKTISTASDTTQAITAEDEYYMVIPGTCPSGAKISVKDDGFLMEASLADVEFEKGKKYTMTLTFGQTDTLGVLIEETDVVTLTSDDGPLPEYFSVSATDSVQFAKGNLFYTGIGWDFESHQWDFCHEYDPSHISTFYWESTGYYGTKPSCTTSSGTASDKVDWGVPYCSYNGLDAGTWRTLTASEWAWLLGPASATPGTNCRTSSTVGTTANARFLKCTVAQVPGLLIFPDTFAWPTGAAAPSVPSSGINVANGAFTTYVWSSDQFAYLESAGCVFLPAAGYRDNSVTYVDDITYYSASTTTGASVGGAVSLSSAAIDVAAAPARSIARAVRLVMPQVEEHEYVEIGGVKRATQNIGATNGSNAWDWYGDYFAWSEVTPRYTSLTFTDAETVGSVTWKEEYKDGYDYENLIESGEALDDEHDAATQNWGSEWRMPTHDDFVALCNSCGATYSEDSDGYAISNVQNGGLSGTTAKGVYFCENYKDISDLNGILFVYDADHKVFFPCAGMVDDDTFTFDGDSAYWQSDNAYYYEADDVYFPKCVCFDLDNGSVSFSAESYTSNLGFSVRPVHK